MIIVIENPMLASADDLRDTAKIIQICLACVIFVANICLIGAKFYRKGTKVFKRVRCCVQLSLAVAGLLSSLFYNVVATLIIFDPMEHGLSCMTTYLSECYFFTFLPLLYSTGLIILTLDFNLRFQSTGWYKNLRQSTIFPAVAAILPWAVSLVVSCPLTLTNVKWDKQCAVEQDITLLQAGIICCIIAPAGLILISVLAILILVHPKQSYTIQSFDSPMTGSDNKTEFRERYDEDDIGPRVIPISDNGTGNGVPRFTSMALETDKTHPPKIIGDLRAQAQSSFENQAKRLRGEKWKLIVFLSLFFLLVMPYPCFFMYVTSKYESVLPFGYVYMVNEELVISHYACVCILDLVTAFLPFGWLVTKY